MTLDDMAQAIADVVRDGGSPKQVEALALVYLQQVAKGFYDNA